MLFVRGRSSWKRDERMEALGWRRVSEKTKVTEGELTCFRYREGEVACRAGHMGPSEKHLFNFCVSGILHPEGAGDLVGLFQSSGEQVFFELGWLWSFLALWWRFLVPFDPTSGTCLDVG